MYVTPKGKGRASFNIDNLFRQDSSELYNTLRNLGYSVTLDMPSLKIHKAIGYFGVLIMFGMAFYIFTAEKITSKSVVLSKNMQILFGYFVLLISIVVAFAVYFGIRNLPPLSDRELNSNKKIQN